MRITFQIRAGLAVVFAGCLAACAYSRPDWREEPLAGLRFEQVWAAVNDSARACGYVPDHGATDRGDRKLVTKWRTREMPFRGGERTRVVAEVVPSRAAEDVLELRFHVERQVNKNMATSFNPDESDWKPSGQEGAVEARFLQHLRIRAAHVAGPGAAAEPGASGMR